MRYVLPLVIFGATASFALGVTLPLLRLERLIFLSAEPSLVEMVRDLWIGGDVAIALLVALFSLVFPTVKLGLLHVAAFAGPDDQQILPGWFRGLANWSMLDVLLVALVIFAAKTSGLGRAFALPGLWFFAVSVVLTVAATALVKRKRSS